MKATPPQRCEDCGGSAWRDAHTWELAENFDAVRELLARWPAAMTVDLGFWVCRRCGVLAVVRVLTGDAA